MHSINCYTAVLLNHQPQAVSHVQEGHFFRAATETGRKKKLRFRQEPNSTLIHDTAVQDLLDSVNIAGEGGPVGEVLIVIRPPLRYPFGVRGIVELHWGWGCMGWVLTGGGLGEEKEDEQFITVVSKPYRADLPCPVSRHCWVQSTAASVRRRLHRGR